MTIRDTRRGAAIERMADHLLAAGLAGASLRPLAAAAGTSDRMLLYYFADRDELLGEVLKCVAARLTARLDAALPEGMRLAPGPLLGAIWTAVGAPSLRPYMHLWLELAAAAARQRRPEQPVATAIMSGFATWAEDHLDVAEPARRDEAALLLVTMEGLLFLEAVGRRDLADRAAVLAGCRAAPAGIHREA